MKKILSILVIALFCFFGLSSCKDNNDRQSDLKSLENTSWYVTDFSDSQVTLSFSKSNFTLIVENSVITVTMGGNYVYENPNFTTSNVSVSGTTISGYVSDEGDTLYLTINGNTAPLTRTK